MIMKDIILDKRYWAYYLFTAVIVAGILLIEDILEGGTDRAELLYDFVVDIPFFTLLTVVISAMAYAIIVSLNRRWPWETALWRRFVLEISIIILIVIVFTLGGSFLVGYFDLRADDLDDDFGFEVLAMIMFFISTFMQFSFHEFMMLSTDKQYLQYKAGRLERQNYLMKYEALKNQVNPHFLFNSLNVLSSLIYQDTTKSDQFIKKFSEVFRYVLELNQEKMVEVKRELKFLDSYFFLQKIRFGDNLEMHQNIDAHVLNMYIPPLTLQLVVENAIKHNVISKVLKLCIHIENIDDELIIKNNYQYRDNLAHSTGIGQHNLVEKYRLISDKLPEFYVENNHYVARLPMMQKPVWNEF